MTLIDHTAEVLHMLGQAAEAAMTEVATNATNAAKHNVTGGGDSTERLNVRTGNLRGSIDRDVDRAGMGSRARIGTNVVYGAIHEFGGTITAKNASGYLRFPTRDGGWASVKQVKMPARPYLRPAVMDRQQEIEGVFAAQLRRRMR